MEAFGKHIFINCPFDEDFELLLRSLLFTVVYLDFNPRIALEDSDASVNRANKIIKLIRESKTDAPTGIKIWYHLQDFTLIYLQKRNKEGYRGDKQLNSIFPIKEYIQTIKDWKTK